MITAKLKTLLFIFWVIINAAAYGSEVEKKIKVEYSMLSKSYVATHVGLNKDREWIRTRLICRPDGTRNCYSERSIYCGGFGCENVWRDTALDELVQLKLQNAIDKYKTKKLVIPKK